jgi:hypothetical protein
VPISHLHLLWAPKVSTLAYSETLCLHQDYNSNGLIWSPILRSQFACALLSSPPPMGSHGLHLGILRNNVPSSGIHLPWPPMVSPTEISVCLCPSLIYIFHGLLWSPPLPIQKPCAFMDSTSHGLLWSPPWPTQKLCAFIRTPPPITSYGLQYLDLSFLVPISHLHLPWAPMVSTLAYSETLCLHQDYTSHGLQWSPLLRSKFDCAHLSSPPHMGSHGLHLGLLRKCVPSSGLHLPWPHMVIWYLLTIYVKF